MRFVSNAELQARNTEYLRRLHDAQEAVVQLAVMARKLDFKGYQVRKVDALLRLAGVDARRVHDVLDGQHRPSRGTA